MNAQTSLRDCGSRPVVGSSRISRRPADQARAEIEPPAHAPRVPAHHPVGRFGEAEPLERVGGSSLRVGSAQAVEPPHHLEVLASREGAVDCGELPGEPDQRPHSRRVADDVAAEHARAAGLWAQQRREHAHQRRLARSIRPEQPLNRAGRHREIDTIERASLAERDRHAGDLDRLCRERAAVDSGRHGMRSGHASAAGANISRTVDIDWRVGHVPLPRCGASREAVAAGACISKGRSTSPATPQRRTLSVAATLVSPYARPKNVPPSYGDGGWTPRCRAGWRCRGAPASGSAVAARATAAPP